MERELFILVRRGEDNTRKEVKYLETQFKRIESFKTFHTVNQIFDLGKNEKIHSIAHLLRIFNKGLESTNCIVNLN